MEMIDVMKRLAELDSANPTRPELKVKADQNIAALREGQQVDECGDMPPMGGMSAPHTPASLSITASSGEELSGMLRDIMQLAGAHQVQPDELDHEPMGTTVSPAQAITVGTSDAEDMRSVMDKLNPMDNEEGEEFGDEEEETDEGAVYDNTPEDPNSPPAFDSEEYAQHLNPPGAANGRGNLNNPRANTMEEVEQHLFAAYQRFIKED